MEVEGKKIAHFKPKFFFIQNLPSEFTRDELRSFLEGLNFHVAAIEVCAYSCYSQQDRKFALVELSIDADELLTVNKLQIRETFKEVEILIHLIPEETQQQPQALVLVGISPLLSQIELMFLLREKMASPAPAPLRVEHLFRSDVANSGISLAHYHSFSAALEAKRSLNIPDPVIARFLGSQFEGALLAEPPLRDFYSEVWR